MRVICAFILVMHVAWSVHLRLVLALFVGGQCVLVHVLLWAVDSCSESALTVKIFFPTLSLKANVTVLKMTTESSAVSLSLKAH